MWPSAYVLVLPQSQALCLWTAAASTQLHPQPHQGHRRLPIDAPVILWPLLTCLGESGRHPEVPAGKVVCRGLDWCIAYIGYSGLGEQKEKMTEPLGMHLLTWFLEPYRFGEEGDKKPGSFRI